MNLRLLKRTTAVTSLAALLFFVVHRAYTAGDNRPKAWTDPDVARQEDPDFAIQGEYGSAGAGASAGVQVVALGDSQFDANGKRTAWPRITVKLNGVLVHEDLELAKEFTTSAPITQPLTTPEGPVYLQNHSNPVVFRNIWIVPHKRP